MNPQGTPTGPDLPLGQSEPRTPEYTPIDPEIRAATLATLSEANAIAEQSPIPETSDAYNATTARYNEIFHTQQGDIRARIDTLRTEVEPEICQRIDIVDYPSEVNQILISIDEGEINNALNSILLNSGNMDAIGDPFQGIPIKIEIIRDIIAAHPSFAEHLVENELFQIFGICPFPGSEEFNTISSFIQEIKESYVESREVHISQNLLNYFQNQDIPLEKEGEYFRILEELEQSGALESLAEELKSGDCSIQYIRVIREFTDSYFGSLGINFSFTSEDANNIIGSVITARRAGQEIAFIDLREDIVHATRKSHNEIQEIFDIEDVGERRAQIEILLQEIEDENLRQDLWERTEDIFEVDLELDIQASRFDEVVQNAEYFYNMNLDSITQMKAYILEYGLSISEAIDEIQESQDLDFSNPRLVEFFKMYPENIWQIQDEAILKSFLEASHSIETGEEIRIYHIHPSLRGNYQIIREVSNLRVEDINYIPDSYFNIGDEATAYSRLVVLLRSARENISRITLAKFTAHTPPNHYIQLVNAIANIQQSQEQHLIPQVILDNMMGEIPGSLIAIDTNNILGLNGEVNESNETQDREQFEVAFQRVRGSYSTSEEDRNTIHNFFSEYGIIENRQAFISLMQSKNIEDRTLINVVPFLSFGNSRYGEVVETGIEEYGVAFTSLLPQEWKSDARVIELTLLSCFTRYETAEHQFRGNLLRNQTLNLETASNILEITDANGLLAAYRGLGENTALLKDYFWHKFNGEAQLNAILDDAASTYTSHLSQENIEIIRSIVEEIRAKQQEEDSFREQFIEVKNNYLELGEEQQEEYLGRIYEIINQHEIIGTHPRLGEMRRYLEVFMESGGIETERRIYNILIDILGENSENEIGRLITEFKNIRIERDEEAITGAGAESLRTSETFPERFRNEIISQLNEDGTNLRGILENIYIQYISGIEGFEEREINQLREDFLDFFFEEYGFGQGYESQRNNIEQIFRTIFRVIDDEYDIENIPVYLDVLAGNTDGNEYRNHQFQTYIEYLNSDTENNTPEAEHLTLLTPQNISSPDLRDTHREISYELNLTQEESQTLTLEELEMIAGDEEVRENFIGFRSTLIELGLTELWKFRNQLFSAISESGDGFNFNLNDGDYIGENEMNIFLSKVVYATLSNNEVPDLQTPPSNLEATIRIIRNINHQTGGPNDIDTVNSVGEGLTRIEYLFRERFAPRDAGLLVFARSTFSEALHN